MTKLLGILAVLIVILGVIYAVIMRAPIAKGVSEDDARALVEDFGGRLKNVSLLAQQVELTDTMQREYGDLVTPVLITTWLADPKNAPGRLTSSPWPDRIEITSVREAGDDFRVEGEIIEVTSEGGGIGEAPTEAVRRPISLTVADTASGLRITAVTLGAYPGDGEWMLSTPDSHGIRFMYPRLLPTTYISGAEWPPVVNVGAGDFSCTEGEYAGAHAGEPRRGERKTIGDREYCVTTSSEGAAGSTYVTYDYATALGDALAHLSFTLRYPQCANYDEPQRGLCTSEQASFDLDGLVDRIASSIRTQ